MQRVLKGALIALVLTSSAIAAAGAANAAIGISLNFGDVALGYRDGYYDSHHRWHHWSHPNDWRDYQSHHGGNYHDWNHDDKHHH